MRTSLKILLFVAVGLTGVACGSGDGKTAAKPATSTTVVTQLAAPSGPSVLEITSDAGAPVQVDFATLDRLAARSYNVFEPFEEKDILFKGVELWTVLQGAGVPASAKTLHLTALDDYAIELSVADVKAGGVILATRFEGKEIPLDHGGPTRLVFLDGVKAGANPDQWIWSVATITAK